MRFSVNLRDWRWFHLRFWLHFRRFFFRDFGDFRFHFSNLNRCNIDFDFRLNFSFHFNFHYRLRLGCNLGGFSRFSSGSFFNNLFCNNRVFRGDDLRLFSDRRSNHFRM